MQARSPSNVIGIDVSHHQEQINWPKVKAAGIRFAFIKATEGKTYTDPSLKQHALGADAAGLVTGYYHYARPENGNSASDEAANFAAAVKGLPVRLPHVLDVEGAASKLGGMKLSLWCGQWLEAVKRLTGHAVMIYTGAAFAKSYLTDKTLATYPLWIAHYGVNTPMANTTWDRWAVFQYADSGTIDGIGGSVDLNVMEEGFMLKFTERQGPFPDVPANHWASSAIQEVKEAGIIHGLPDGTFAPDKPLTRAEAAAIVANLIKK